MMPSSVLCDANTSDQKSDAASHFNCFDQTKALVPFMMPFASSDTTLALMDQMTKTRKSC